MLRDMFVVVASILIAFGLDAWSGWYGDRRDEHEKLLGLHADFTAIAKQLQQQVLKHAQSVAATDSLLQLTGPDAQSDTAQVQRLVNRALIASTLDVSSGTLNAILAGGRLEVIRNSELRSALAAWEGVLRDATEDEADSRAHVLRDFVPLLADAAHLRARFQLDTTWRPQSRFALTYDALLTDPRVAGALDFRAFWIRHTIEELNIVRAEVQHILTLIEAELGGHGA
jgi:hypothetical protein